MKDNFLQLFNKKLYIGRFISQLQSVESHWLTLGALIVFSIFFAIFSSNFMSLDNLLVIGHQSSFILMVAVAQLLCMVAGGIDLSVGSTVGLSGIVFAGVASQTYNIYLAILAGLIVGIVVGFINGFVITRLGIMDIIATLAMLFIAHGFIYAYSGGHPIYNNLPPEFNNLGQGKIGPISMPIILALLISFIVSIFLNRTKIGRYIFSVGGNSEVAFRAGINTKNMKMLVYILSGLICGFAGVVLTSRLGSGQPATGESIMLDSVAAVILGGASLSGGIGTVTGTIIGVAVIGILSNGLTLIGASYFTQEILKGVMLILAVILTSIKSRRR